MATKKELLAQEVAKAVGAGKTVAMETVDFNDPNRPKTCLEVDFPILPVNQVAIIEGNAGKPIYQMSKWWARRRSSVFRSMLIAAATKAPEDKSHKRLRRPSAQAERSHLRRSISTTRTAQRPVWKLIFRSCPSTRWRSSRAMRASQSIRCLSGGHGGAPVCSARC